MHSISTSRRPEHFPGSVHYYSDRITLLLPVRNHRLTRAQIGVPQVNLEILVIAKNISVSSPAPIGTLTLPRVVLLFHGFLGINTGRTKRSTVKETWSLIGLWRDRHIHRRLYRNSPHQIVDSSHPELQGPIETLLRSTLHVIGLIIGELRLFSIFTCLLDAQRIQSRRQWINSTTITWWPFCGNDDRKSRMDNVFGVCGYKRLWMHRVLSWWQGNSSGTF